MWADPVVTHYTTGRPSTPQQSWMRMLGYAGHWALLGFGYWAVVERRSGVFIGEVGFADFKRGIAPELDATPEMGLAFAPHAHGRGLASEALLRALAWADDHLGAHTIALIQPENAASVRVAERVGYRKFDAIVYNGTPTLLFERKNEA